MHSPRGAAPNATTNHNRGNLKLATKLNPTLRRAVCAALLATLATPAFANNEAMLELLKVLRDQGTIKQDAYEMLRNAALADEEHRVADTEKAVTTQVTQTLKTAKPAEAKPDPDDVKVTLNDGLKFKTADGNFSAQVGTFLQFDSALYGNDPQSKFGNGTELRRGRISVLGTVYQDWDYKFEADFAGTTGGGSANTLKVTDAFVRYKGIAPLNFTFGNFKPPYSLEAMTSDTNTTFTERALPFSLINDRLLGAQIGANGSNWTAAAGVFGAPVTTQNTANEGLTGAARVTFDPILQKDRLVHLGASGQIREPDHTTTGLDTVRFSAKPESNIIADALTACSTVSVANATAACRAVNFGGRTGFGRSSGRLVDTGSIGGNVNYWTHGNVEAAGIYGPFSLQGEYVYTDVDRDAGDDLGFESYYVQASLFLTDDVRAYKGDKGYFDPVQPKTPFKFHGPGWGAWEVAARFSALDLNDQEVHGGRLEDFTAGLNWYANRFVRFSANYVTVVGLDEGAHDNEDLDALQFRAQVQY